MKNESKSSEPQDRDRLSELHDSLIFNIYEFLPMKYVVRTQILSHRWKNLWTLTPFLNLENEDANNIAFRKFVNRVLLCWRGTRVQKFKVSGIALERIYIGDDRERALFTDFDSWLRFAVKNGVEDLDLSSYHDSTGNFQHYCVPKFLYSCLSLKKLSLSGSIIEFTGKAVQWNQLLSLTIQGFCVTALVVKHILHKSPLLEVFNISFEPSDDNVRLNIQSGSLKVLSICKTLGKYYYKPSMDTELRIWTPKLEVLRIEGMPYGKCLLRNVSSLTHVTLWFYSLYDFHDTYDCGDSDDYGENLDCSCMNDYLEGTLSQILPAIQHVEGLTLSDWSIKVLLKMNSKSLLSSFSNVKSLSLNGKFKELVQILCLLEVFPKLETLVVKEDKEFYVETKLEFKWNPSMYFLDELRTVEVAWNQCDFSIFPLIQSLLRYARELQRMVFRVKEIEPPLTAAPPNSLVLASDELCKMPRSSPNAELIICEN